MNLKDTVRSLARSAGYDIRRHQMANRFDAMNDTLAHLARQGFQPATVIDVGAYIGDWTRMAQQYFLAKYHLIEPQTECRDALEVLAGEHVLIHPVAVTRPGIEYVRFNPRSTGSFIGAYGPAEVPASTIDALIDEPTLPLLLKLDIQGHELEALSGASKTLTRADVVITEVSFFPLGAHEARATPTFVDYFAFFQRAGFTLYDFAALGGRTRDRRLTSGDCVFVKDGHALLSDNSWE